MRTTTTRTCAAALLAAILLLRDDAALAFAPSSVSRSRILSSSSSSSSSYYSSSLLQASSLREPQSSSSTEDIKKDIEAMRKEALARLEALNVEMEEVKKEASTHHNNVVKKKKKTSKAPSSSSSSEHSLDFMEGDLTKIPLDAAASAVEKADKKKERTNKHDDDDNKKKKGGTIDEEDALLKQHQDIVDLNKPLTKPKANLDLLDDTRWKIMFNIGREPGTWMPPSWGKSGDRLRFYAIVDFTGESLLSRNSNLRDDFFEDSSSIAAAAAAAASGSGSSGEAFSGEGGTGGTKELRVVEAWLGPTYTEDYHGRKALNVSPVGAYKVVRGAGPLGTDVLRFYIETKDFIAGSGNGRDGTKSDVSCPQGRIYGNCGYFPVHAANERDPEQLERNRFKEALQKEHRETANKLEALQRQAETDERGMFTWDALKRMKESMGLRSRLEKLEARIQEARQRDPDRSTLRLSLKGNVGVTREGGVCCKVQKGITVEYHILGRMELGPVEKVVPEDHEDYQDLVNKQVHP